ncbi:MAG: hypothetical protein ACFE8N_14550, partial [Promethearchaeota archaeon]
DYHRRLYHRNLSGTSVPSPSIGFQHKIVPLKIFIESMMNEAEKILKSFGFTKKEFTTIPRKFKQKTTEF